MKVDARALIAAWRLVQRDRVDAYSPGAAERLAGLPGWSILGLPSTDLATAREVTVLDAIRALALLARQTGPPSTSRAVATTPLRSGPTLNTREAVHSLLSGAVREILVVGFTITDRTLVEMLVKRARAGVAVTVVGDRKKRAARDVWRDWPAGLPLAALEDVEPLDDNQHLHAKAVVVDRARAVVGSANFTLSGMSRNIELGVLVEGPAAIEIVELVERLMAEGWLTAVR